MFLFYKISWVSAYKEDIARTRKSFCVAEEDGTEKGKSRKTWLYLEAEFTLCISSHS